MRGKALGAAAALRPAGAAVRLPLPRAEHREVAAEDARGSQGHEARASWPSPEPGPPLPPAGAAGGAVGRIVCPAPPNSCPEILTHSISEYPNPQYFRM